MVLRGQIQFDNDGMTVSTRAMMTQMTILNVHTDNIANFGVPGYQRKEPVTTSFVEYLGPNAVDKITNTEVGRVRKSGNPLDVALGSKGYFQRVTASGAVELTRDGRFKLDVDGYLRALDGKHILSSAGTPVKFDTIPEDLEKNLKITREGNILVYDKKLGKLTPVAKLGVVSETGTAADKVDVQQGHVEDANVMLQQEYVAIVPLRRQFEANRQLFILQSDSLNKMIQELGRAQ